MKFNGELKFPEIDHPGVPVVFVIDDKQAEILVGGESLGRWSLYDIHARRLVASAFQIDLEGTEVTFVADDPIDFAYRGVEHMAKTWADIKSKRIATRVVAVRKSRSGATESRVEDLRAAMEQNLESFGPRRIAGEPEQVGEVVSPIARLLNSPKPDYSKGEVLNQPEPEAEEGTEEVPAEDDGSDWDRRDGAAEIPIAGVGPDEPYELDEDPMAAAQVEIERARRELAEERARFEEERRAAEEREANLLEAYRLEMERLDQEREQLRRQPDEREPEQSDPGAVADEPAEDLEEPVVEAPAGSAPDGELVDLDDIAGLESDVEPPSEEESPQPPEPEPEPRPSPVAQPAREPEPALAGTSKDKRGIMGAVKAAFGTGASDHQHSFIEAPGGIGITRYVCEECGYVSISVGR